MAAKIVNKEEMIFTISRMAENVLRKKMETVGDLVVRRARAILEGNIGHSTDRIKNIHYEIKDQTIIIYSDDKVLGYLEHGTKPHIIRPKKAGGALAFQTGTSGQYKSGKTYAFGDTIVVKEVHHPGFEAKPFISRAVFISQNEIKKILSS